MFFGLVARVVRREVVARSPRMNAVCSQPPRLLFALFVSFADTSALLSSDPVIGLSHSRARSIRRVKDSVAVVAVVCGEQRGSNAGHPQFRMVELSDSRVSGL